MKSFQTTDGDLQVEHQVSVATSHQAGSGKVFQAAKRTHHDGPLL